MSGGIDADGTAKVEAERNVGEDDLGVWRSVDDLKGAAAADGVEKIRAGIDAKHGAEGVHSDCEGGRIDALRHATRIDVKARESFGLRSHCEGGRIDALRHATRIDVKARQS